jgi:1-pyrroline-5-carboxylate dehydrogenase
MLIPYQPTSYLDYTQPDNRASYEAALQKIRAGFGKSHALLIGGEWVLAKGKTFTSVNPARHEEVVGEYVSATRDQLEQAIAAAQRAFPAWAALPVEERAFILLRAARLMKQRRNEFSALMTLEAGKNWNEADADTAEAIDFLEFYAREAIRLQGSEQPVTPVPGENNGVHYLPLGVGAVIPPWNFPLAILAGMTSAAIVCGNTVVLKPASDTPAIGLAFVELLIESGLPAGVVNFITGSGAVIGDPLVEHPAIRFISFTGSRDVGSAMYAKAAIVQPGQKWLKLVVAEMGGKDFIVVDDTWEDLDEAAAAIVQSAFGFQGQKCSACSRLVLTPKNRAAIIERVVERTKKIVMGAPENPANWLGPVSSAGAFKKISSYLETGKAEGKLLAGGESDNAAGYFIRPAVFDGIAPGARLSQEEIFGPVLSIIHAKDFNDALNIANGTDYGLTGALFSLDRTHLARARKEFHVGNLYLNRKCTGALVDVQPFGGFNMSGTDSKAGGRDYLLLFTQAKSVTERF